MSYKDPGSRGGFLLGNASARLWSLRSVGFAPTVHIYFPFHTGFIWVGCASGNIFSVPPGRVFTRTWILHVNATETLQPLQISPYL